LGVALGESLAGYLLYLALPLIRRYPHILALYPILAAARGNIYSSLASRITSRLHLGLLEGGVRRLYAREAARVLVLSVLSSLYSATVAYLAIILGLGEGARVNPLEVYATATLTPLIMAAPMTGVATGLAMLGFSHGLDPDEYLSPILTVTVDIVTLPVVTAAAVIAAAAPLAAVIPLGVAVSLYTLVLDERDRRVVAENLASIVTGSSVEFLRSYALMYALHFLEQHPLVLSLMPVFNAENGAAIAAAASRLSTLLHLGLNPPSLSAEVLESLAVLQPSYLLSAALLAAATRGGQWLAGYTLLAAAGLTLIPPLLLATRVLGEKLYEKGFDPDNTLIPIMTTLTDIAGTLTLLAVSMNLSSLLGL